MGKFYAFLLGIVAGFGLYHLASTRHLIRTDEGLYWTPKVSQSLEDTYADIRGYGPEDWAKHPALAAAIAKSGNDELMGQAAEGTLVNVLDRVLPADDPPANQPE